MSSLKNFLGGLDPDTWTDAKAGYLDAGISSRAPSSTALSTATWTNTKAGYLDSTVSSRAPASTALSSNVWTTTYRNRIDTTISSRLGTCSVQHLSTNTAIYSKNSYSTWTVSSVNTSQSFLTGVTPSGNQSPHPIGTNARIVNSTNVRYLYAYGYGNSGFYSPMWNIGNHGYAVNLNLVRIY